MTNGVPDELTPQQLEDLATNPKTGFHVDYSNNTYTIYQGDRPLAPVTPPAPNWIGLEQGLRYSDLFGKAFQEASDKGLNLFMVTLLNGKCGEAKENALVFAFSMLGVTWTTDEIEQLNTHLENNHFTIRI